jgi:hypothetical protein
MTDEQLQELERLRYLWLVNPEPTNISNYILALEAALWQTLPHPEYTDGYSWRLFGWDKAVGGNTR